MTSESRSGSEPILVSLAIFAWNEEAAITATLNSLFQQTLFAELSRRQVRCEVLCMANGCTDCTPAVAEAVLQEHQRSHPYRAAFSARLVNLKERGKVNAWNQFVHAYSAREAQFLCMMDADILIHRPETIWNMIATLQQDPQASVAVDRPCKDIQFKARKSWRDKLALSAAQMTLSAEAQLCGQLYCVRAEVGRNIFLPKDLAACEDGFIKALVCTDFLAHDVLPGRLRVAADAEHTFEAYTSPAAILKNQKRQIIGQTIVHILVDDYLKKLPAADRQRLPETLKAKEAADPSWLKRLISEHLQRTRFFWQLYPGLLGHRLKRLSRLSPVKRVACLPAAAAGMGAALLSSFLAYRALRRGCTDSWPQAKRLGLDRFEVRHGRGWTLTPTSEAHK